MPPSVTTNPPPSVYIAICPRTFSNCDGGHY